MDLLVIPLPEAALPGNRLAPGEREQTVYERPPIEESDSLPGSNLNTSTLVYPKEQDGRKGGGDGENADTEPLFAPLDNTFSALIELAGRPESAGDGEISANAKASLAAKAVEAYETNVKVVEGSNNPLGASLSITL